MDVWAGIDAHVHERNDWQMNLNMDININLNSDIDKLMDIDI